MAELLTDIVQSKIVFVNNSSYICRGFLFVNRGDWFVFHTFNAVLICVCVIISWWPFLICLQSFLVIPGFTKQLQLFCFCPPQHSCYFFILKACLCLCLWMCKHGTHFSHRTKGQHTVYFCLSFMSGTALNISDLLYYWNIGVKLYSAAV